MSLIVECPEAIPLESTSPTLQAEFFKQLNNRLERKCDIDVGCFLEQHDVNLFGQACKVDVDEMADVVSGLDNVITFNFHKVSKVSEVHF